jgi:hypothetical protein
MDWHNFHKFVIAKFHFPGPVTGLGYQTTGTRIASDSADNTLLFARRIT